MKLTDAPLPLDRPDAGPLAGARRALGPGVRAVMRWLLLAVAWVWLLTGFIVVGLGLPRSGPFGLVGQIIRTIGPFYFLPALYLLRPTGPPDS